MKERSEKRLSHIGCQQPFEMHVRIETRFWTWGGHFVHHGDKSRMALQRR